MDFNDYTDYTKQQEVPEKVLEIIEKLPPKDRFHFQHLYIETCRRIDGAFDVYNMFGMYNPDQRYCAHMLTQILTNQFKVPVSYIMGDNFLVFGCSIREPILEIQRRKSELIQKEVAHA